MARQRNILHLEANMASRRAQTDEAALRPHQFLSLYVFVPSDDVRLVIGKGGATIQDLQATTNTKIRIDVRRHHGRM